MAAIKFIKRTVALDGSNITEQLPASFFNSEASAHTFIIAGVRDGTAVAFTGSVSAIFHNANDADVSLTGSVVDGAAVVTLSNPCYALSGRFTLTIDVNGATVYECNSRIKRRSSGTAYDPDDELSVATLSAEIAEMRTATAAANTAATNANTARENMQGTIAPTFSASTAYSAGDYVWYNGTSYRFVANHAAGSWVGTDAIAAVIGNDLRTLMNGTAENAYENFIGMGEYALPTPQHIFPYKSLSGGRIVDNQTAMLFHNIPVKTGYIIHFLDYTGYRYYLKRPDATDYKTVWYTSDYRFTEDTTISVYVKNTDGTNLTDIDIDNIINVFRIKDSTAASISDITDEIGNIFLADSLFYFKKVLNTNGTMSQNDANILLFYVDVKAGDVVGLKDYTNYKFSYKTYSTYWSGASSWQSADYTAPSDQRMALYIRRQDGTDVTATDFANAKEITFVMRAGSILVRLGNLENQETESSTHHRIAFENIYVPTSLLTLPTEFSWSAIPVKISRIDGMYGHNLNPYKFMKNNSYGATYYVSVDGSDSNAGTSPSAPLATITAALGKTDVNTIVIFSGEYINGTHFDNTTITVNVNIIGVGEVILKSASAQNPMKFGASCYVENIIFDGGYSACATQLTTHLMAFNKCKFINSSNSNGLSATGGYYVLFDCEASNNMLDGFNYHSNGAYLPNAIEVRCYGSLNGDRSSQTSNNGSTMHESGGKIIRIGCEYSSCRGGVVTDADGAMSVNICVRSGATEAISASNRNGNYVIIGASSKMWLYDCVSFGSPYDIIADEGTIYTNMTYQRETTANDGTISRLT